MALARSARWRLTPKCQHAARWPVCVRVYIQIYILYYNILKKYLSGQTHRYDPLCGQACQANRTQIRAVGRCLRSSDRKRERGRERGRAVKENFHRSKVNECRSVRRGCLAATAASSFLSRWRCHRPIETLGPGRPTKKKHVWKHVRRANSLASKDPMPRRVHAAWLALRALFSRARLFARHGRRGDDDAVAAAARAGNKEIYTRDDTHRRVIKRSGSVPRFPILHRCAAVVLGLARVPSRRCRLWQINSANAASQSLPSVPDWQLYDLSNRQVRFHPAWREANVKRLAALLWRRPSSRKGQRLRFTLDTRR